MTTARDDDFDEVDGPAAEVLPMRRELPPSDAAALEPIDAEFEDDDAIYEDDEDAVYDDEEDGEEDGEEVGDRPLSRTQEMALRVARPLPTRRDVLVNIRWWSRWALRALPWLPVVAVRDGLWPILRGLGRVAVRWSAWVHAVDYAESVKFAEGNHREKAGDRLVKRRSGRAWGSVIALFVAAGVMSWLFVAYHLAFWAVVIVLGAVLEKIGLAGRPTPVTPFPVAMPSVLTENVPLSQITSSILATFDREGFEEGSVSIASPLTYDPARKEYRIRIKTADQIKPEHVRAIERAVGARDYAIRNLATTTSSVRELVIRVGDPLANTPPPEFLESHSRTIALPLDLGESAGDVPFDITFAGVHVAVVGATGSGKTKGLIWTIIDRLSSCRDCVIWGCDLARGPALPMWRGVIQKRAQTPEEADALLTAAIAEIERRMAILTALAEDDDPNNDADEWHAALGPALVLVFDEFAILADFDGKSGKLDLLGKVEQIIRTGRKVWLTIILGTQKTGNSDFGSSVMATQLGVKILLACSERDTVTLFGVERRDQGWAPHLLAPSVEGDVRDAGKCYVESPAHRTPDIYRTYAPLAPAEVKRRARQRIADGLPTLDGRRSDSVDAVEVPPALAEVEKVFADVGNPQRIATAELVAKLRESGFDLPGDDTTAAAKLAELLRPTGLRPCGDKDRWRPTPGVNPVRGYYLRDVRAAIARLS